MDFDELYQKYSDTFSKRPSYVSGSFKISQEDLLNKLGSEIDLIIQEDGSLDEFAEPDDPNMILQIYSVEEAEFVLEYLQKALR